MVTIREQRYDLAGERYAAYCPELHKYPASMLPQLGVMILNDLQVKPQTMLDPYCGGGSSFVAGIDCGVKRFWGFDLNPLAIYINQAKFTKLDLSELDSWYCYVINNINNIDMATIGEVGAYIPTLSNIDYWFAPEILIKLGAIRKLLSEVSNKNIERLFMLAFFATVRNSSLTRKKVFKLHRLPLDKLLKFSPDVKSLFLANLQGVVSGYQSFYYPRLQDVDVNVRWGEVEPLNEKCDVVLTSPPYGDSQTTISYGQFSIFANAWLGYDARKVDKDLMGGRGVGDIRVGGIIQDYINRVAEISIPRARRAATFYHDLRRTINKVAQSVKNGGYAIYIVGNRRVSGVVLPTDKFVSDEFKANGFSHVATYKRLIGNKRQPRKNSPKNKLCKSEPTINYEYIVIAKNG